MTDNLSDVARYLGLYFCHPAKKRSLYPSFLLADVTLLSGTASCSALTCLELLYYYTTKISPSSIHFNDFIKSEYTNLVLLNDCMYTMRWCKEALIILFYMHVILPLEISIKCSCSPWKANEVRMLPHTPPTQTESQKANEVRMLSHTPPTHTH